MKKTRDIMVCVTGQRACDRLISRGFARRDEGSKLHVVHCVQTGRHFLNSEDESDAIEYLFTAAQLAGGDLTMLRTDDVEDALVDYANENGVELIIMGAPHESGDTIVARLQRRLPEIEFDVVG